MTLTANLALQIMNNMHDALITVDLQGLITSWNRAAERIYGWQHAEVLGHAVDQVLQTDYSPLPNYAAIKTQLIQQGWWSGQIQQRHRNGQTLTIHSTVSVIYNDTAEHCGVVSINRDITDYAQLLDAPTAEVPTTASIGPGDGFWEWDIPNHRILFSSRMHELLERPAEQYVERDKSIFQMIHPDDFEYLDNQLNAHLQQRQPFNVEIRLHTGDTQDTYRWFLIRGQARWNAQGYPMSMLGTMTDIDDLRRDDLEVEDRKRNLEARFVEHSSSLQHNLQLVGSINAATPDFIYTYNLAERRFAYTNRSLLTMLGYEAPYTTNFSGHIPMNLVHPDDLDKLEAHFQQMTTLADDTLVEFEYRLRDAAEQWRWFYCREMVFQRQHNGQIAFILGIASDITLRKQTEDALRQAYNDLSSAHAQLDRANRLKNEFLANMTHELRTPLNAIIGRAESLLEQLYGHLNPRQHNAVVTIGESGRHLLELINDLLDLSKIEADRLYLEVEPVSIQDLCEACQRLMSTTAEKHQLTLRLQLDPALPLVFTDGRRLRQILLNLLANAIKFTPAGGHVDFQATWQPEVGHVVFTVVDNGIGIAEDDMDMLFQPFVQIDSGLQRQFPGTGLGLALVARLVDRMGGSIRVTSKLGQGSRFTIFLATGSEPLLQQQPKTVQQGLRVLLADDHGPNLIWYETLLSGLGYQVRIAHDGKECLQAANAILPDLMVIDLQMPQLAGIELIQRLRAIPALANTPLIALTALDRPNDEARCRAAGATHYLHKPLMPHLLLKIFNEI
ncbi:PAS domain-containing protein [Candidatus Viridilinea mediisalina]|uniref:Circadian input-output histidine kinase CikA n=1 Tax=Candidatus Viridilinea mediisalina TaxID=2024553 RepID=A0A2A6RIP6_9CHLR|nr:PAS domain-containing protein [Candidatus Viridilinea mediisalina]PDW02755.1 hypothetical protein CJ255_12355 [Candidatus Viridilinea mediisalina]